MIELDKKITLYHGSYTEVIAPDLRKCNQLRDFGQGFYVTTSREQAVNFVNISIKKAKILNYVSEDTYNGYINKYDFTLKEDLKYYFFDEANIQWLHYIAGNRKHEIFTAEREGYDLFDIVAGKIANDQTNATLTAYLMGLYGTIGSKEADNECISHLLPNRLQNQICFKTEKALSKLIFTGSEKICIRN